MQTEVSHQSNLKAESRSFTYRLLGYLLLINLAYFVGPKISITFDSPAQASINPSLKETLHSDLLLELKERSLEIHETNGEFYEFNKELALEDFYSKIDPHFRPSKLLNRRVGFWFDIYAKYDDNSHIIHHSLYPWIVFEVVSIKNIRENKRLHRWTRYHRAKNFVKNRRRAIRKALKSLAKRRHYRNLTKDEKIAVKALKPLRGSIRYKAKIASKNMRSQTGQKNFFAAGISRYGKWIHQIEQIFKKYRLPLALTRIPFVESSFNPDAVSKVGASGVWQLMPSIGRKFLKVNDKVDERNDPIKAAHAAAKLLRENKMLVKKWPLAVTAYNTGVGQMRKAIRQTKSTRLERVISRFSNRGHGFASNNFYASFLAALHVEQYKDLFFDEEIIESHQEEREIAENESVNKDRS